MGLTVSDEANLYYSKYSLSNSNVSKNSTVDSSSVSKSDYNVPNLTNALDALNNVDSFSFRSISNVDSFAKSIYAFSQLKNYDTLSSTSSNTFKNTSNFLSNTSDLNALLTSANAVNQEGIQKFLSVNTSAGSGINTYQSYLNNLSSNNSGSLLDALI